MSDHLPLDKHIKEQLGQYAPDVPPHIWDQIVAQRERQRPKGFWFSFLGGKKWLLAVTLLLGLGGTAYWLTQSPDAKTPSNRGGAGQNANSLAANQPVSGNQPATGNNLGVNNANTAAPIATPNTGTGPNNNSTNNTTTDNNTVGKPAIDKANTSNMSMADKPAPAINGNKPGNMMDIAPLPASHRAKPAANPFNLTAKKTKTKQKAANAKDWVDADAPTADNANGPLPQTSQATDIFAGNLVRRMDAALPITADKQAATELQKRLLYNLLLPDCPTIEDNAAANKKYLEVYGGPDFALRSFGSFTSDTSSVNYLQKRKESAKFSSAFSAGLRYTKVFNNGMSLRSGINYSQINEKFLYINEKDIRYILVITPRQIISGGNTITVYDTLRYTETGKRIKTTYNRYRSIDVPLQLGYEFGNGRLHTNISAGAIINLYSWQKGDVLDSAYQPVSITTGKGSSAYGFKTNIGVGFLGSISVYYKLSARLHALAEPYFRYNLQPMTRDNQNVTQKYSTLGLRLGLRWDFK